MAELMYINSDFIQKGPICALAAYGIIIEYFSFDDVLVEDLLENYVDFNSCRYMSYGPKRKINKHKAISEHFHGHCQPLGMRGFDYIVQLHSDNSLRVRAHCKIFTSETGLIPIPTDRIENVKVKLRQSDALAMVLYKVTDTMYHAVVAGFDQEKGFFYKDPEKRKCEEGDVFHGKEITEVIVFESNDLEPITLKI